MNGLERLEKMKKMRSEGMSYRQIAAEFGISYQRVHQMIGTECHFRPVKEDECIYKGLRDWMNENRYSRTHFVRLLYGKTQSETQKRIAGVLRGKGCTKTLIDRILDVTGLPYEVAFKVEGESNDR